MGLDTGFDPVDKRTPAHTSLSISSCSSPHRLDTAQFPICALQLKPPKMTAVSSRRGRLAFLFFFCALALTASLSGAQAQSTTAPPPSKCEICRDKGDCSMAFANQPGQFCGHWLDAAAQRRACCCAIQDTCVREVTTECKCQKGKQSGPAPAVKATPAPTPKKEEKSKSKIWIIIGVIVFLGLVGVLVFMYMRRKRENEEAAKEHDNYASTPHVVVESTTYVQQAPPQATATARVRGATRRTPRRLRPCTATRVLRAAGASTEPASRSALRPVWSAACSSATRSLTAAMTATAATTSP
ncbi:hypothetical protein PINS_up023279 [Pythium insidiosum]|nr:hypothetical protein PINS_up023279 [Pythium insidiosum]